MIAFATLFVPLFVVFFQSYFIPSASTIVVDTLVSLINFKPPRKLDLNLNLYGKQTLLVRANSIDEQSQNTTIHFIQFLENYYNNTTNKLTTNKQVNLQLIDTNIGNYVFDKRIEDLRNLVSNYYVALEFNFVANRLRSVLVYYSSMAFHSKAVGLNEVNSLVLAYETDTRLKSIHAVNWPLANKNPDDVDSLMALTDSISAENMFSCLEIMPFTILDVILGK